MSTVDYKSNSELLTRVKNGDSSAVAELTEANMGLIRSIALRFKDRAAESHGCDFDDLMQIGAIGIIKAINSYDASFGTAFSTYAVPLIIGEIKRFLRDDGAIKISRTTKKLAIDIMRTRDEYTRQNGNEPTIDELSQLTGVSVEEICQTLLAAKPIRSFSDTVGDDGTQLGDLLPDTSDELEILCDKLALRQAIRALPKLWRDIIIMRYFKEMSQQQTAEALGLTQVKISREEKKIIAHLRDVL